MYATLSRNRTPAIRLAVLLLLLAGVGAFKIWSDHQLARRPLTPHATYLTLGPNATPARQSVERPLDADPAPTWKDEIVTFKTADGLTIEGKLSLPPAPAAPFPVVFLIPGAGPWTFDRARDVPLPLKGPDDTTPTRRYRCCDFWAGQLTKRGIAFFRANKRGCTPSHDKPYERIDSRLFAKATPSVLLADCRAALASLRARPEIDKHRVVLLCTGEGTVIGPRLALADPAGIISLTMIGYVQDNPRDQLIWRHREGRWRSLAQGFDIDGNGKATRQEYEALIKNCPPDLFARSPCPDRCLFDQLDRNRDGILTPDDTSQEDRLAAILQAVRQGDDDALATLQDNLSSAYFLEEWNRPPNHLTLLELDVPLMVFHGTHDAFNRVEGVSELRQAFQQARKRNLGVRIYPWQSHNLNWLMFLHCGRIPPAYADLFEYLVTAIRCRGQMNELPLAPSPA